MPIHFKTDAATAAVRRHEVTATSAQKVEQAATSALASMPSAAGDAFETVSSPEQVRGLSSSERALFDAVFGEMLGNVAEGFSAAAAATAARQGAPAEILGVAEKTQDLPAAWLVEATKVMQNVEFEDGYYDYRVALHGDDAQQLVANANLGEGAAFNPATELLLVNVAGYDELTANVFAMDVSTAEVRKLGYLGDEELSSATHWDGHEVPERFAKAVLLPTSNTSWDSGDELAGFEDIPRFNLPTPMDFDAMVKLPPSKRPELAAVADAIANSPVAVTYQMAEENGALKIAAGNAAYAIEGGSGSFTGAGWTSDVTMEDALHSMAHPRLAKDAWNETESALYGSHFGLDTARPLLWLEESNGATHVLAFSGNPEKPYVLELMNPPLSAKTYAP